MQFPQKQSVTMQKKPASRFCVASTAQGFYQLTKGTLGARRRVTQLNGLGAIHRSHRLKATNTGRKFSKATPET